MKKHHISILICDVFVFKYPFAFKIAPSEGVCAYLYISNYEN